MKVSKIFLMSVLSGLLCFQALAQETQPAAEEELFVPADELDRGTPGGSGDGFMLAVDEGDYEAAAEYLDLRNLRGPAAKLTGKQLARRLAVIISRGDWVEVDDLVYDPKGRLNDGLPDYRDLIGVIASQGKEVQLLMQKVPRGDGVSIWKVSNSTVSMIPDLYEVYGYSPVIEDLRRSLPQGSFLGFEVFKWILVLAAGAGAYLAVLLTALLARRADANRSEPSHQRIFRFMVLPFGIWVVIMTFNAVATSLGSGVSADEWRRITPVPILVTAWMLYAGVNLMHEAYSQALIRRQRPGAASLLKPAVNAVKTLIALGAVLVYLDKLGFNITTLLAGLGVGGVAIALALQKPMEDVFGAFTLFTQQPIRVGDFCRVGSHTGVVEEIGLRTTRLRTLANTLIAIPNSQLANEPIDNISAREKIRYRSILRLRYDTGPEQVRQVLTGIREMLGSHDRILEDSYWVRFSEIADDALLVDVHAYLGTTVWSEYLELAEDINMRILGIVAGAGTSLSLPARSLYMERGAGGAGIGAE